MKKLVKRLIAATMRRMPDWCRCGGKGYWYEQISGKDNLRRVECPKHWWKLYEKEQAHD